MMVTLKITNTPRRLNSRRKEKNHEKTSPEPFAFLASSTLSRVKNGFETRTANLIDKGAAAIRAELKQKCADENVKFLGEYDIAGADENLFTMDIETFVRFAQTVG